MNIFNYFRQSFIKYPHNTALVVDGSQYTYEKINEYSGAFSEAVKQMGDRSPFIGLFAHRSVTAYSGILGILQSGKGYVPLNPKFPHSRNKLILNLSQINTLILGKEVQSEAIPFLNEISRPLNVIIDFAKEEVSPELLSNKNLNFFFINKEKISNTVEGESTHAYLLFTSGSTGLPKGVPISHNNVCSYINYMFERYQVIPSEKFSQTFDLTFDLSVHDMFLCWCSGAALYCVPEKSLMGPAKFIIDNKLTYWFSVPSVGMFMNRFKMLRPNSFPSLKVSLFCGEPLPAVVAESWQNAASNSIVENIYGPTETTIGISHYRYNATTPDVNKTLNEIISIGKIFSSQQYKIVDEFDKEVMQDEVGELCLAGEQVTSNYLNNIEATKKGFVRFNDSENLWYKTGDLVVQDSEGDLFFKSRKDFQVKILGHRVELEEINLCIKSIISENTVISLPYPVQDGIAQGVYSFVLSDTANKEQEIIDQCKQRLPDYMVPKRIIFLKELPLNDNKKIDLKKLEKLIPTSNGR